MKGDLIHFEIAADDPEKLAAFYTKVLGWKVSEPMADMDDYRTIMTREDEGAVGGGLYKRTMPEQGRVNYYEVESIEAAVERVRQAGGQVVMEKMAVPKMGYFAVALDPEGNPVGLWLTDENAA